MRYRCTPITRAKIKNNGNTNAGEDIKKLLMASGNVKFLWN